ncbi:MAG: polyprenyl synthetase family protein, partial [bacterium]
METSATGLARLGSSIERVRTEVTGVLEKCDAAAGNGASYSLSAFSSGKMARTKFTLLLGDALGLERTAAEKISVCAELLHDASLLHDDCVDGSLMRRGRPTANERLGTTRAILMGDLVVTHAFRLSRTIPAPAADELIFAAQRMAEGALAEERARYGRLSPEAFLKTLSLKTGS